MIGLLCQPNRRSLNPLAFPDYCTFVTEHRIPGFEANATQFKLLAKQ